MMSNDTILGDLIGRSAISRRCKHIQMDSILPAQEGHDTELKNISR
jgi:hypothetical protein